MKLKSRITSFAAATVLVLTMTAGVFAESSVDTSISLTEIACSASITSGNIDFGTWRYDPSVNQYRLVSGSQDNPTLTVTAADGSVQQSVNKCEVTLTASDLTNSENTSGATIPVILMDDFQLGTSYNTSITTGSSVVVYVRTNTTLDNRFDPLMYTGTITITSVSSSN